MLRLIVKLLKARWSPPPASVRPIAGTERYAEGANLGRIEINDMDRWSTPHVDAFLRDIFAVCEHHRMSISHQDDGAFIVGRYNDADVAWLGVAQVADELCR